MKLIIDNNLFFSELIVILRQYHKFRNIVKLVDVVLIHVFI